MRMLLSDGVARLLLVLHTVLAVAAVAAATHLLIWLRRSIKRGDGARFASTKRFASYALALHFAAFVVGNLMYPTYKMRVRVAYLENPVAISSDMSRRAADRARIEDGAPSDGTGADAADSQALAGARMARWFDVKEHLLAFGLGALLAVWLITRRWQPQYDDGIGIVVVSLVGFAAATGWIGAIIGVLTAAWRAI